MADAEPKLLLPALRPFYDAVIPLSWLIVRVAVGWNLLVHGWGKIMAGPTAAFLKGYSDIGFNPPEIWFWSSTVVETTAGVALILGLFTRFFAAAAAIELLIITLIYWKNRLRLDPARLRIHADVGTDQLRHRAARRRAIFARPQARAGALIARRGVTPLCPAPVTAKYVRRDAQAFLIRRGGRVVECTALEMRHTGNRIGGSNSLPLRQLQPVRYSRQRRHSAAHPFRFCRCRAAPDSAQPRPDWPLSRRPRGTPAARLKNLNNSMPWPCCTDRDHNRRSCVDYRGRNPWSWNDGKPPACPGE